MVSIPLFVLLLATYAYSVPVVMNDKISKENLGLTTVQPAVMNLIDDVESVTGSISGQVKLTTPLSFVKNERVPREMLDSFGSDFADMDARGIRELTTLVPNTLETTSQSGLRPRGIESWTGAPKTLETTAQSGLRPLGIGSWTVAPNTLETTSQSVLRPRAVESWTVAPKTLETTSQSGLRPRGMESWTGAPNTLETTSQSGLRPLGIGSWTVAPNTLETTSQTGFRPRAVESWTVVPNTLETTSQTGFHPHGIPESSTLLSSTVETSTQFNDRKIFGQKVSSGMVLPKNADPSSSLNFFGQTTGLLRNQREQAEGQESTSMSMDEATSEMSSSDESSTVMDEVTAEVPSTGRSKTVIEVIPGRNTKTEIIPGPNTETEIITSGSSRLVGGKQVLSQGKNQPVDNKKKSDN